MIPVSFFFFYYYFSFFQGFRVNEVSFKKDALRQTKKAADAASTISSLEVQLAQLATAADSADLLQQLTAERSQSSIRLSRLQTESEISIKHAKAATQQREQENEQLTEVVKNMRGAMARSSEDSDQYEKMYTDLQKEHTKLLKDLRRAKAEKEEAAAAISALESETASFSQAGAEMKVMREALEQEKSARASFEASAGAVAKQLAAELSNAKHERRETANRLEAAEADLKLARQNQEDAQLATGNLQRAMENLQNERDSEIAMVERANEGALGGERRAFEVKLGAVEELHRGAVRNEEEKSRLKVEEVARQVRDFEKRYEAIRLENVSLRRSLDSAIKRLQASQEDIIDRAVIKSVVLDWHSKTGPQRNQVMAVIGSMLHFSKEENASCSVWSDREAERGAVGRVVSAVAAPLPAPVVATDKLEGDSVKDKFLSFLMSESGDL